MEKSPLNLKDSRILTVPTTGINSIFYAATRLFAHHYPSLYFFYFPRLSLAPLTTRLFDIQGLGRRNGRTIRVELNSEISFNQIQHYLFIGRLFRRVSFTHSGFCHPSTCFETQNEYFRRAPQLVVEEQKHGKVGLP